MTKNLKLTKDLNDKFKSKINELKDLTLDQEKYNSLVSELISKMSLDEKFDEEEKDDQNNNDEKQSKHQNQEQKTKDKEDELEELSIDSGVPDLENGQKTLKAEEELEIENNSRPDLQKRVIQILEI